MRTTSFAIIALECHVSLHLDYIFEDFTICNSGDKSNIFEEFSMDIFSGNESFGGIVDGNKVISRLTLNRVCSILLTCTVVKEVEICDSDINLFALIFKMEIHINFKFLSR